MLPDRVSNPGPLTYESGALPIALRGPAPNEEHHHLEKESSQYQNHSLLHVIHLRLYTVCRIVVE